MTRKDLLRLLLHQAQFNGFEFRRWFRAHVHANWPGAEEAIAVLATEGRYYALLFSHDFVRCFWRKGAQMSFSVPGTTYSRITPQGHIVQITRKPFTRRTIKPNVWKYHLQQMASAEEPIQYLCRFLPAQDQLALHAPQPVRIAVRA